VVALQPSKGVGGGGGMEGRVGEVALRIAPVWRLSQLEPLAGRLYRWRVRGTIVMNDADE
jgi:hypothetical protein